MVLQVRTVKPYGAYVEMEGFTKHGLLHISQLSKVSKVSIAALTLPHSRSQVCKRPFPAHKSLRFAQFRVESIEEVIKEGDPVFVKVGGG